MTTRIQQSRSVHATRSVQVTQREPPGEGVMARIMGAPPIVEALVAHVTSDMDERATRYDGNPPEPLAGVQWSTPAVIFERLDSKPSKFTRAQWETVKREIDQAFDLFEQTWPAADPCADGHDTP
jgi:hypothetical protein